MLRDPLDRVRAALAVRGLCSWRAIRVRAEQARKHHLAGRSVCVVWAMRLLSSAGCVSPCLKHHHTSSPAPERCRTALRASARPGLRRAAPAISAGSNTPQRDAQAAAP